MTYKNLLILASLIAFAFILSDCSQTKRKKINSEIVLQIGQVEISQYELEKNRDRSIDMEKATSKEKEKWLAEYIDETYILADALDKRYDTLSDLDKVVNYAAKTMMSRVDGYLWNHDIAPKLVISKKQLEEFYEKRNILFQMEFISFTDPADIEKINSKEIVIKNLKDFNTMVSKSNPDKNIYYQSFSDRYPFSYELILFCDQIYDYKESEVYGPLFSDQNAYFVHLLKKETIKQKPLKDEKKGLEMQLKELKTNQYAYEKRKEISALAKIEKNITIADTVAKILSVMEIGDTTAYDDQIIMSYWFKGKRIDYYVRDLTDYCNNNPLNFVVQNKTDLYETLDKIVLEEYLFDEAESKGVTSEMEYILDRKNFKNRLMSSQYERKEFINNIKIDSTEMLDFYKKNIQQFTEGQTVIATILTFKDIYSAYNAMNDVKTYFSEGEQFKLSDTSVLKGLQVSEINKKVAANNKDYSEEMVDMIFKMSVNEVSEPMEFEGKQFIVCKKSEEGKRVLPFEKVKGQIDQEITSEKFSRIKNARLDELKKKYKIIINKTKV